MTYKQLAKELRKKMRGWEHCPPYVYGCYQCELWYALSVLEHALEHAADLEKK